MSKNAKSRLPQPTSMERKRIRRENATKPPYAPYSIETHDAARDLWIFRWNDSQIAQALGIRRRETVTEWAQKENWLDMQRDYRKRIQDRTLEVTAQKVAEANARQLSQIDTLKKKVFSELEKSQLHGKTLEGVVRVYTGLLEFERKVMLLDAEIPRPSDQGDTKFQEELTAALERLKGQPEKVRAIMSLHRQRILIEGWIRGIDSGEENPAIDAVIKRFGGSVDEQPTNPTPPQP